MIAWTYRIWATLWTCVRQGKNGTHMMSKFSVLHCNSTGGTVCYSELWKIIWTTTRLVAWAAATHTEAAFKVVEISWHHGRELSLYNSDRYAKQLNHIFLAENFIYFCTNKLSASELLSCADNFGRWLSTVYMQHSILVFPKCACNNVGSLILLSSLSYFLRWSVFYFSLVVHLSLIEYYTT